MNYLEISEIETVASNTDLLGTIDFNIINTILATYKIIFKDIANSNFWWYLQMISPNTISDIINSIFLYR